MIDLLRPLRDMGLRARLLALAGAGAVVAIIVFGIVTLTGDDGDGPAAVSSTTTTNAPAATDEVDDDLDPLPTDTPAAISVIGGGGEPWGAIDDQIEPPTFDPVYLEPLEDSGADAFIVPPPVEIPDQSTGIGDITSNAVGCASDCITRALITPRLLSADIGFEIETNVATTTTVWVSTLPIFYIGGRPTIPGAVPIGSSDTPETTWSTTIGPLSYSTTYNVVVRVDDLYGNSRYAVTEYTTVDRPTPGQIVGNGGGCYYQCIVSGTVFATESYDTVLLAVTTSVPVDFDISISQSEPGYFDDLPFLPKDEPFVVEQDSGTAIGGSVSGLQEDTTYHVVVKVTDENGFSAHAVGEFHTAALPPRVPPKPTWVLIQFERITIDEDGDAVGAGEIKLVWGLDNRLYEGVRDYEKIDSGETIVLPEASGVWYPVFPGDDIPNMVINAVEQDRQRALCGAGTGGTDLLLDNYESFACGRKTTVAHVGEHPLTWLESLQPCSSYFTVVFGEDRACVVVNSGNLDDDWVVFRAIISFTTWREPDT